MDHTIAHYSSSIHPDFSAHEARERLENRITELAAHIAAATYELLVLIGRYDAEKGWVQHGTARQLEQVVRNYRMCGRLKLLNEAREAHALRELNWLVDEDGCWVLKGRFTPEQGAVIRQALEKVMDTLFDERQDEHPDVSAETPRGGIDEWQRPHSVAARRADAPERLAESFLGGESGTSSGGDRYVVNIHTEADVLAADGEAAHAECEECGRVSAVTSRRLACDAAVVRWHEDANGEPLSIERKSRTIPPAIRRALHKRDGGCRFPGCSCRRFVDAHHIRHWADCGGAIDYNYAQGLLEQYDAGNG